MVSCRALFTDLDGTLYNWIDYFAPSFRAMVHVLARETSLDEDTIIESFRRVYVERGTLEYSYSVQELDIWEDLNWPLERIMNDAVRKARGAFNRVRHKHLSLFPDVKETLKWAREERVRIFAYTSAPRHHAHKRLRKLYLDRLVDCLVFFRDCGVPGHAPQDVLDKKDKPPSYIECEEQFTLSQQKPDPTPLRILQSKYELDANATFMVGDSLEHDVLLAQKAGIIDIWARYGHVSAKKENIETIQRISTFSEEEKQRYRILRQSVEPTYTIDGFGELRSIIGSVMPHQLALPI
jgi:FMN phosphatase YigB (HAD superfamily)